MTVLPLNSGKPRTCVTLNGSGIQLAVGPQPLRLRNHNSGLAHRIMVKRLATSPHDPLGITDSACKNQLVVVSVQYGPFNPYIPTRSTTIGKSRVAKDPIAMHTSWRSNSDIASVTSIGYPRMSASGESSTTMHRLLHASGSHPIPTPYDPNTCVTLNGSGIQLAVDPQPLRLRNHNSGLAHRIMVKRLATSPHDPLGITDSACKNQLVVVSVQYGPFNPYIPTRSTTIGKSRVAKDPIAMHTSWRSNSDITSVTSIGYPRMSASGESSTTMHRLLHASGSHPIPMPYDPKTKQTSSKVTVEQSADGIYESVTRHWNQSQDTIPVAT
ncbi:thioredoxin family protein [Dorcoceras hygrometricum]|uniref:Thioredoxin family protein n=1 Tax=Dorcoceras hygrometricum TaxID=472368 RepID=A0A2Z7BAT9_9LAMI|nr:thioredoxin family protein [Dorcoceras hygrometricum]